MLQANFLVSSDAILRINIYKMLIEITFHNLEYKLY